MYLMIVEDEYRLRNNLANNIPWAENGIEICGLAESGLQAIHMLHSKKTDIIMIDIEMPEMDGLTAAKQIIAIDPQIKIVILSGHDNFTYAQKAIEMGVSKYILKPAGDKEILDVIVELSHQIQQERESRHSLQQIQQKWREHLPRLQEHFLQEWMQSRWTESEILEYGKSVLVRMECGSLYVPVQMEIDPIADEEKRFSEGDIVLLQFSLRNIVQEVLRSTSCLPFADRNGMPAVLFVSREGESKHDFITRVNFSTSKILSIFKSCLKVTASAGIGECVVQLSEVPFSYQHARNMLMKRVIYGNNIAISYRKEPNQLSTHTPISYGDLESALESGNESKIVEVIDQLVAQITGQANSEVEVQEALLYINTHIVGYIMRRQWPIRDVVGNDYQYFISIRDIRTKNQLIDWLYKIINKVVQYYNQQREMTDNEIIQEALQYIENHLHQELRLYEVSEKIYLNSSYLSRLFKKEMGVPFSNYVLQIKMERAKACLDKGYKVREVAEDVGYKDLGYFTKVFRKYWGYTPKEAK